MVRYRCEYRHSRCGLSLGNPEPHANGFEDAAALKADADFLASHPNYKVILSGHCDERGSEDYNMALGSNRADGVRDQLVKLGIAGSRIKTISYGKEKPFCDEPGEKCWQQNRRAHFSLGQQ